MKTSGLGTSGDHTIGAVGTGEISSGNNVTVYNDNLTDASIILVTSTKQDTTTYESLVVVSKNATNKWFIVGLAGTGSNVPAGGVTFNYLIIN
jgi:hypothetical protein